MKRVIQLNSMRFEGHPLTEKRGVGKGARGKWKLFSRTVSVRTCGLHKKRGVKKRVPEVQGKIRRRLRKSRQTSERAKGMFTMASEG